MASGQELLEETTSICKEIAEGLGSQEQGSQAWEESVTEILGKFDELSGSFFFKTMPSIPAAKACRDGATALLQVRSEGNWAEFGPGLERFIGSAQDLIEKAGMKGTTLT